MERLQSAIEKARQKRVTTGVPPGPAAASTEVVANWASIARADLDPALLHENKIVSLTMTPATNPFDILRTKTLLRMRQNGWKRLGITSPLPANGKTTVSANLVTAMTRQSDLRTILLDFDLSKPGLAQSLGISTSRSVSDLLTGSADFDEVAVRISDNVGVAVQNNSYSDPTRLLLKEDTNRVIERIEQRYAPDLVIFDLPPVLVNDSARAVMRHIDCVMIVIGAEKTSVSQVDNTEREVAQHTNVLGLVLNAARYIDEDNDQTYASY